MCDYAFGTSRDSQVNALTADGGDRDFELPESVVLVRFRPPRRPATVGGVALVS